MRLFNLSTLFAVILAVMAGAVLFWASQSVQQAEDRLYSLTRGVEKERQSIRVLQAEWAYLNRPDRLEALASEHLGLSSPSPDNIAADTAVLPDLMVPAIPSQKPALSPQPIVHQPEAVSLEQNQEDFTQMLERLKKNDNAQEDER